MSLSVDFDDQLTAAIHASEAMSRLKTMILAGAIKWHRQI
jgi:hypothetical protein